VKGETRELWIMLCEQAALELDPLRLLELVGQTISETAGVREAADIPLGGRGAAILSWRNQGRFHQLLVGYLCWAYSPAPIRCSDTYGSSPTTQLSCPGAM